MKLVIVESPAKAKTIAKYLGSGYTVDASRGHILDLPVKTMGIDINNNYKPEYIPLTADQKKTIANLKAKVKKADEVFLATDPDREGEAISWHLQMVLGLDTSIANRITFNEISNKAVNKAVANPTHVNMNLVDAQQARRVLDRLVGYTVSPVLCKKITNKLSAGRVQSAALRLVVDREKEIAAFVPEEYWTISAMLAKPNCKPDFKAVLTEVDGTKGAIADEASCKQVLQMIDGKQYVVDNVKKSVTQSKPQPPFTTSTLQQDAVNKLGMKSSVAMQVAQQLYEGIELGSRGHVALVTYIRTDSVRVSTDAIDSAREYIANRFGEQYIPEKPNFYSTKKKSVQDAHEAIRPINLELTPESLKDKLQSNQYRLYKLIYNRFLASQSTPAKYNSVNVSIKVGNCKFTTTGKTVLFDGYTAIYAADKAKDEKDVKLPNLEVGDTLQLLGLTDEQKFTKGPSRYTEASLIKAMEDSGIGRPSTYSATMATLYKREYVTKDGKYLFASSLGITVTDFLMANFEDIVDIQFTADMEQHLDDIEDGTKWQDVVDKYYRPIALKAKSALNVVVQDEPSDELCEKCNSPMVFRVGKYGKYLACTNEECRHNKSLKPKSEAKPTDEVCEKCGSMMLLRSGKNGEFLACSNYPKCKNTKSVSEVVAKCPDCGGDVHKRMTRRGKPFYGCSNYPECKFASWDVPTGEKCPKCNSHTVYNNDKTKVSCSNKECDYTNEIK